MIKVSGFKQDFNNETKIHLKDIEFDEGKSYAILGVSGGGKTTLLNAIAGIRKPTAGSIVINGTDITKLSEMEKDRFRLENIGYIFQDYKLIEDMSVEGTKIEKMGSLAHYIKDRRLPIEMCLSSNVDTGVAQNYATHPFNVFYKNNFRVFLNVDNRLMSNTTITKEYALAVEHYGLNLRDLEKLTINAMKSSFLHHNERIKIIYDVIKIKYADIRKNIETEL